MLNLKLHNSFHLEDINKGHHNVTYRGISAIKCPFDYVIYQMIIFEIKPDLIIEIGTNAGGSALYLADMLNINGKGMVHTIDLPENQEEKIVRQHPRIKIFKEGFLKYNTKDLSSYDTILVIEDGSHLYEDSLAALQKFSPYVTKNSYYIVEDGIISELGLEKKYKGGPQKAIREFLSCNKEFVIDNKWCDFFGKNATFNQNGYLKKVV